MSNDTVEFRSWLKTAMKEAGIDNQSALANASLLGLTLVSSYLSGARKPDRKEQVEKLTRALLPPGGGVLDANHLLEGGLRAAGLAPEVIAPAAAASPLPAGGRFADEERAGDPGRAAEAGEHAVLLYLRGQPRAIQDKAFQILKAVFED